MKDMDFYGSYAQTVTPLPFAGMKIPLRRVAALPGSQRQLSARVEHPGGRRRKLADVQDALSGREGQEIVYGLQSPHGRQK